MKGISFFDVNCMVGSWLTPPLPISNSDELIRNMEYVGIEKAVIYHSDSVKNSIMCGNEKISKLVSDNHRFEGAWVIVPGCTREIAEIDTFIEQMRYHRIKFLRLFPTSHRFDFANWQLEDWLIRINEYRIPILLESSQAALENVYSVSQLYHDIPIILTKTSYWPNRELYELGRKCPNVYFEISSFLHYNGIEDFASKYGVHRLIFGTNMPFQEPGPAVFRVLYSDLDLAGKQAVAGGNLEEIITKIRL